MYHSTRPILLKQNNFDQQNKYWSKLLPLNFFKKIKTNFQLFSISIGTSEAQPVFKIHILLKISSACNTIGHRKPSG